MFIDITSHNKLLKEVIRNIKLPIITLYYMRHNMIKNSLIKQSLIAGRSNRKNNWKVTRFICRYEHFIIYENDS